MWATFNVSTASNGPVLTYVVTTTPTIGFGAPVQTESTGSVSVPAIIPSTTPSQSTGGAENVQGGKFVLGIVVVFVAGIAASVVL
jgi:hypothetical protein